MVGRRARRTDPEAAEGTAAEGHADDHDEYAVADAAQPEDGLTARIQMAFKTFVDPATGRPFSPEAVAAGIRALVAELPREQQPGRTISRSYLYHLKDGTKVNPTARHLDSLAAFYRTHGYRIEADFFLSDSVYRRVLAEHRDARADDAAIEQPTPRSDDERLNDALQEEGIQEIVFRARGLSPESLEWAASMLDHARKLERLDEVPDRADRDGTDQ